MPPSERQGAAARRRRGALALALIACAPDRPPTSVSPVDKAEAPHDLRIAEGSDAWDVLAGSSPNPLRWAYRRGRGLPAQEVDRGIVFIADGSLARVDLDDGALRWRDASRSLHWRSLVVADEVAVAASEEGSTIRVIDLLTGAASARPAPPKLRSIAALGPVITVDDACTLSVRDARSWATLAAIDGLTEALADATACSRSARLVTADRASATLLGWRKGQLDLVRVERSSGAVSSHVALDPEATLTIGARTGVILEVAPGGASRALRLDAEGPIERRWSGAPDDRQTLREALIHDRPPIVLIRTGERWSALDPITLAERWTITSDAEVAISGETTTFIRKSGEAPSPPEIHLVDPDRGTTLARRRLPEGRGWWQVGELTLVAGEAGVVALDLRSDARRWALRGEVESVRDDGIVTVRGSPRDAHLDVIDAAAGIRRLRVRRSASLLTRAPAADGDLSILLVDDPAALAAYADDPALAEPLPSDPITAFAAPCPSAPITLEEFNRYRSCHPPEPDHVRFTSGSAELTEAALATLDRLALRWRHAALADLSGPRSWPVYLVRGSRDDAEPEALAGRRAEAVRSALLARGVPCSQVRAVSDPQRATAQVEIAWHEPIMCLL